MKAFTKFIIVIFLAIFIIVSCSNPNKMMMDEAMEVSMADVPESEYSMNNPIPSVQFVPPVIENFIATSAAYTINDDEDHKFIRTATLRFKVNDVVKATSAIEDIIVTNKGFIIKSQINSRQSVVGEYTLSDDSLLTIMNNYLEGSLNLKVPCELLNQILHEISPLAVYIDYRTIEAEDVTVKLLSDKLERERMLKKQKRMGTVINTRSGKLEEAMDAEERIDAASEQADRAYISTFTMNERIAYSVINIQIYQDPIIEKKTTVIDNYEPGFGMKAIDGLSVGWGIICAIFLFFVNIWPIILLLFGISFVLYFKLLRPKNRKK